MQDSPSAWTPPPAADGVELRDRADEAAWRRAIDAIGARHGLDTSDARLFASGSDVVFGTREVVFKLTDPKWREQVTHERAWLAHVHGRLSVATPRVLGTGELEGWPYTLMSRVEGEPLGDVWSRADPATRLALARDVGRLVAEWHALQVPTRVRDWDAFAPLAIESSQGRLHALAEGRGELAPLAREALAFLADLARRCGAASVLDAARAGFGDARRVCLHTELLDQHVLVDASGDAPRPVALIDLADAEIGPPDYDTPALVEFVFRGEPGALGAFFEGYDAASGRARGDVRGERCLAWSLCHRFASLPRLSRAAGDARDLDTLSERLFA